MTAPVASCGFCGLLCDDITPEHASDLDLKRAGDIDLTRSSALETASPCALGAAEYLKLAAQSDVPPRIAGAATTLPRALQRAVELLRGARRPLFGGLGADLAGQRTLLDLARRVGATVDHAEMASKYRNLNVLQEYGWIATTFSEARNRADLFLLIGSDWWQRFPRFVERVVAPQETLFGTTTRRVFHLGPTPPPPEIIGVELSLDFSLVALPEVFAWLAALAHGAPLDPARAPGGRSQALAAIVDALRGANYPVLVWSAAELDYAHAELSLHALARLVRRLNTEGRAAVLPLAGSNADLTANAVATWQTGLGLPLRFSGDTVDFDPHRFGHRRVLQRREADVLLWVSSLDSASVPPADTPTTIVVGRPDLVLPREPEVFIPVASCGAGAAGHLLRSDMVVCVHLPARRQSRLPEVAGVLDRLLAALD